MNKAIAKIRLDLKTKSNDELKEQLRGLYDCIEIVNVFSTHDLIMRDLVDQELTSRGFKITEVKTLEIESDDAELTDTKEVCPA
jgi:hypothetical protein